MQYKVYNTSWIVHSTAEERKLYSRIFWVWLEFQQGTYYVPHFIPFRVIEADGVISFCPVMNNLLLGPLHLHMDKQEVSPHRTGSDITIPIPQTHCGPIHWLCPFPVGHLLNKGHTRWIIYRRWCVCVDFSHTSMVIWSSGPHICCMPVLVGVVCVCE